MFRNEKDNWDYNIAIYFDNNRMSIIDTKDVTNTGAWFLVEMPEKTMGKNIQYVSEMEHFRMTYFLNNDNGQARLYGFARTSLISLN